MTNKGLANAEVFSSDELRLELIHLNGKLASLSEIKTELDYKINEFNRLYLSRLGGIIQDILVIRISINEKRIKNIRSIDEVFNNEYQQAKFDYEAFKGLFEEQALTAQQELNESDVIILKAAYRKASRLCHPDKLDEVYKSEGQEIFKKLSKAFRCRNLILVQDILFNLESNANINITPTKSLLDQINDINSQIDCLEVEIKNMTDSEIVVRINSITDINDYLLCIENELKKELAMLKKKNKSVT